MRYIAQIHIRDDPRGPEQELQAIPVETLERMSGVPSHHIRAFTIGMGSLDGEEFTAVMYAAIRHLTPANKEPPRA